MHYFAILMVRLDITINSHLYIWDNLTQIPLTTVQPEAPATRQAIFSYNAGDIEDSVWQTLLNSMPTDGTSGNPKPDTQNYYVEGAVTGTYLNAQINMEVPTMIDGRLYSHVSTDSHDEHNQVRARVPDEFLENWHLRSEVQYRFDLEFEIVDASGINWSSDPSGVRWAILFQIWGPRSSAWASGQHPLNPPLSLSLDRRNHSELRMEVQLYGTEDPAATDWEYSELVTEPIALGTHTASVWWKKDHEGLNSYARVDIDGDTLIERANEKLGTPFDANGNVPSLVANYSGGVPSIGVYTPKEFADPGVEVYFDKYEIYRE